MQILGFVVLFCLVQFCLQAQTGIGIGIYPTGSEGGVGLRSAKDSRWLVDARLARASLFSERSKASSFVTEASVNYRLVHKERLRFHLGLGFKGDWNTHDANRLGGVVPIGIEAFPFPFQNAGLFFEAAPFFITGQNKEYNAGIRTAGGLVFYFQKAGKQVPDSPR